MTDCVFRLIVARHPTALISTHSDGGLPKTNKSRCVSLPWQRAAIRIPFNAEQFHLGMCVHGLRF